MKIQGNKKYILFAIIIVLLVFCVGALAITTIDSFCLWIIKNHFSEIMQKKEKLTKKGGRNDHLVL